MGLHIHIHTEPPKADGRLDEILKLLRLVLSRETKIMAREQELLDAMTAQTTVTQGLVTLVNDVEAKLLAQGIDQATIDQALAGFKANTQAMSDALVANTPHDTTVGGAGGDTLTGTGSDTTQATGDDTLATGDGTDTLPPA